MIYYLLDETSVIGTCSDYQSAEGYTCVIFDQADDGQKEIIQNYLDEGKKQSIIQTYISMKKDIVFRENDLSNDQKDYDNGEYNEAGMQLFEIQKPLRENKIKELKDIKNTFVLEKIQQYPDLATILI